MQIPPNAPSPEPGRPRDRYRENLLSAAIIVKDTIALLPFLARSGGSPLFLAVPDLSLFHPSSRNGRPRLLRISRPPLTAGSTPSRTPPRFTATRHPSTQLLQTCQVRLCLDRPIETVLRMTTSQVRSETSEGRPSYGRACVD